MDFNITKQTPSLIQATLNQKINNSNVEVIQVGSDYLEYAPNPNTDWIEDYKEIESQMVD